MDELLENFPIVFGVFILRKKRRGIFRRVADGEEALQFQDMTSQLVRHTQSRLLNCADRIACETLTDDDGEAVVEPAPLAPNPVTQAAMDEGSVELF